jgi:hypothetical protein
VRANTVLWWILAAFFIVVGVTYVVWSLLYYGAVEWAGTVGLGLAAVASVFLAFYFSRLLRFQHGTLPEDLVDADVDDGDPELGFYSPWSWWPIFLAGSAALLLLGLAVGFWISLIGLPLLLLGIIGWVYEYYRGYFSH